jgi:hypothetical protein
MYVIPLEEYELTPSAELMHPPTAVFVKKLDEPFIKSHAPRT